MYGAEVATEVLRFSDGHNHVGGVIIDGPELPLSVEPKALGHLVQAKTDIHTGVPGVITIVLMTMTMTMTMTTTSISVTITMTMKNITIEGKCYMCKETLTRQKTLKHHIKEIHKETCVSSVTKHS